MHRCKKWDFFLFLQYIHVSLKARKNGILKYIIKIFLRKVFFERYFLKDICGIQKQDIRNQARELEMDL